MNDLRDVNAGPFQEYGQKLKSFCEKVIILNAVSGVLNVIIRESIWTNLATIAIYYYVYTFAMKLINGEHTELSPFLTVIKVVLFLGVVLNGLSLIQGVPNFLNVVSSGLFDAGVIFWMLLSIVITAFVVYLQFTLLRAHFKLERQVKQN